MRISHKFAFGLAALVGALLVMAAATVIGLLSLEHNARAVNEEFTEFVQVVRAQEAFADVGARPLEEVTGPAKRAQTRAAIEQAIQIVDRLERAQYGPSELNREHGQIEITDTRGIETDLSEMISLLDAPRADEPLTPESVQAFDRYRTRAGDTLDALGDEIRDTAVRIHDTSDNFYRRARNVMIALSVIVAVGSLLFVWWLYRKINGPLVRLRAAVGSLTPADGFPEIRLGGDDELSELAEEFNRMSGRLREVYQTLERRVAEKSRQLVRSERLASTGFLAAGVAHEINNPLAAITGHAESLLRRMGESAASDPPGDPQQRELFARYLQTIRDEAFRCKEITTRLLDFSRLSESPPSAGAGSAVDLCAVVNETVDLLSHVSKYHGRRIEVHQPDASPLKVRGTPEQLKQVMMNLLVNALEAGGAEPVRVQCDGQDERVSVRVIDRGVGIDAETLEKIFEPFFSARTGGRGTGLGLSISLAIVEGFGGQLSAASDGPGRGATFTVTLPRAR
ncbi:MAG: Adaptive-response sensory-kinase SasA [Phycisphaerae bacterium]|nr:Adaptive-response sensory-kinase SasA [Phycisphaerae bacterium]